MFFVTNIEGVYGQCTTFDYPNNYTVTTSNQNIFETMVESVGISSFGGNIIFQPGVILTLDASELRFNTSSKIIINPGARITFSVCILTSCDPDGEWKGVQVRGNSLLPYSQTNQGRCHLKNTMVENAEIGICNYDTNFSPNSPGLSSGGVITTVLSEFKNCNQAVELATYSSDTGHLFDRTDFTWDYGFNFTYNNGLKPMFSNNDNKDVIILDCDFVNTNPNFFYALSEEERSAIYVRGSSANILLEGTSGYSNIIGFTYGFYSSSNGVNLISNVLFKCARGVLFQGQTLDQVIGCRFSDLPPIFQPQVLVAFDEPEVYGFYLHNCTDYIVRYNIFRYTGVINNNTGIIVLSSGPTNNLISYNDFQGCTSNGIAAVDDNRSNNGVSGLKLSCNIFRHHNFADILIEKTGSNPLGMGIKGIHSNGFNTSVANRFYSINTDNDPSNGYNIFNDDVGFLTYFHHLSDNLTEADGNIFSNGSLIQAWTCPGKIANMIGDDGSHTEEAIAVILMEENMEEGLALATEFKSLMNQEQIALDNLVDGGDTEALTMEVLLSDYSEALDLYYELMAKSPSLSVEVMTEAINQESTLPSVLLTMILKSNPTASKSDKIQQKLDERMNSLSEYQRYMIDQGKQLISQKEAMESSISYYNSEYNKAMNSAISFLLKSSVDDADEYFDNLEVSDSGIENVLSFINGIERISDYYLIAKLYAGRNDFEQVYSWISNVAVDFELNERQEQEHEDYTMCYEILQTLYSSTDRNLDATQYGLLEDISSKERNDAAGFALGLMISYSGYDLDEYIPESRADKVFSPNNVHNLLVNVDETLIQVYPNPAHDYVLLQGIDVTSSATIHFMDVLGNNVLTKPIDNVRPLDIRSLKQGIYIVSVYQDGDILVKQKLQITR